MRLFVGIPLAPAVVEELKRLTARLRRSGDGLRWTAPESWHITLVFLGNTEQERYECMVEGLRALHLPPVTVCLEDPGIFDRAGVFHAGVKLTPELVLLQQRVAAAAHQCGFAAEARPYQPHITLARGKDRDGAQALRALTTRLHPSQAFTRFVAGEFLLYESFLGPSGARYEVRTRFPLDGR